MVIDDKGREIVHKDSEKMTKGEKYDKVRGSIKI
jgi:hypothetical protein